MKEPKSTEDKPFAYDRVRVIGPSPINHGMTSSEWEGASGAGVLISPLSDFAANLDEPYGKLTALYNVVEVPDHTVDVAPKIRVINSTSQSAGPTPEEVFAKEAPGKPSADGKRGRTPAVSPLDDPRPKPGDGPLGPAPKPEDE